MNKDDLSYAAGLFDGEGSVIIGSNRCRRSRSPYHFLVTTIGMTHFPTITWMKTTFGGRINIDRTHRQNRPMYVWILTNDKSKEFLTQILPYLKCKGEQAILAIEFRNSIHLLKGKNTLSEAELQKRESYRWRLKQLNFSRHLLPHDIPQLGFSL